MSMTDTEDQDGVQRCPYCSQAGGCDHVLLVVDTTFRSRPCKIQPNTPSPESQSPERCVQLGLHRVE